MRFRIDFGWDPTQSIYAYFEAENYEDAALHARRLWSRIRILQAAEMHENAPLPGQTLTLRRIDASRWLDAS